MLRSRDAGCPTVSWMKTSDRPSCLCHREFADICGLDRTYIGGIERGERNVSLVNIGRIAKALKISIPRLFKNV